MPSSPIAFLPLGAFEQHGPHLPFATDAFIAQGFADYIAQKLPPNLNVLFLPVEEIGYSIEHCWKEETKSLSYSQALEKWLNVGAQCAQKSIRKLLLFNAHGGNSPLLTIIATELRARYAMLCVTTSWTKFGFPENFSYPDIQNLDIHAGFMETSLMLALKPEIVSMEKAKNFANRQKYFCQKFHYLRAYGPQAFGWMMQDLNPEGACGAAHKANAKAGYAMLEHVSTECIKLLQDMQNFDLELFAHC